MTANIFTKSKLCLTNVVAFYKGVAAWWMREDQLIYLCKAFDTVQCGLLISELEKHGADRRTTQRAMVNDPVSECKAVTSGLSQGLVFGLVLFNIFVSSMNWGIEHTVRVCG